MLIRAKKQRGFTLIELMMVIAIIGILAAIITTSLNSARSKGKDTKIREEMRQLANLAVLNNDDYGSYCNLQPSTWVALNGTCSATFATGAHAAKAQEICTQIVQNSADDPFYVPGSYSSGSLRLYSGSYSGGSSCNTSFSFMTFLNNGKWYCIGSSGRKGEYATFTGNPGCYDNP